MENGSDAQNASILKTVTPKRIETDVILEKLRERHVGRVPEWEIIIAASVVR
jgi:hypothetical protein